MRSWHTLLLAVALACCTCSTTPTPNKSRPTLFDALSTTPMYTAFMLSNGTVDIMYCCWSFRNKNDRWPKDYSELSEYVKNSDRYLILGDHADAELNVLATDALEISWVPVGLTNQIRITLGPPGPKP